MKVMGKVWSVDAIFKNVFTSPLGTIVALDESRLKQGLLVAGTDDGLVRISRDNGNTWERMPGHRNVVAVSFFDSRNWIVLLHAVAGNKYKLVFGRIKRCRRYCSSYRWILP